MPLAAYRWSDDRSTNPGATGIGPTQLRHRQPKGLPPRTQHTRCSRISTSPSRFQGGIRVNHLSHSGTPSIRNDRWNDEFHPVESVPNRGVAVILYGKDFALLEIKHPSVSVVVLTKRPLALPSGSHCTRTAGNGLSGFQFNSLRQRFTNVSHFL